MKHYILRFSFIICTVLVVILSGCAVKIEKININDVSDLNVGDTYQVVYTIEPDNAADKTLCFESSDESIAVIDQQGLIRALAPGKVKISAYPENGKKNPDGTSKVFDEITITIIQPVESIVCEPSFTMCTGKNQSIDAEILPENSSDKTLVYKSSDDTVVTVDNNGVLTGIKKGNAVISMTSVNGVTAECQITVKQPVTGIQLDETSISLTVNKTKDINAVLSPDDADFNTEVVYISADNSVATVDENGVITAVSSGSTTITATAKDVDGNALTATCEVRVSPKKVSSGNQSSSSSSSPSSSSSSDSLIDIGEVPPIMVPCSGCDGSGYMLTGVPCYMCHGEGKLPWYLK